jgi:acetylornithine deacetylase
VVDVSALDSAVERGAARAFDFLERLVAAPSTVGAEAGALEVFGAEIADLGFAVRRIPVPADISSDPRAGIPPVVSSERYQVVGTRGPAEGRSLLLNGHIDVVPAESPHLWTSPPFTARREGSRLYGRGAGDMKAGFAMGVLALRSLLEVHPDAVTGPLTFLAAIEEECTGNGTLSAARAGVLAEAAVLLEPTDLGILVGGVGVLWCDVEAEGVSAHAESAHQATNPIDLLQRLTAGLRRWAEDLGLEHPDDMLHDVVSPYNVNVGQVHAGDWPSSVPTTATMRIRVGYPRAWSALDAEREVRSAVRAIVEEDAGFPVPPAVRLSGFRAEGYFLDPSHPLVTAMADAHEDAHGVRPSAFSLGSTTDARFYVNDFGLPALCYGPSADNIHGVDESVDLDTVVAGAKTLARFIAAWYAPERSTP